MSREYSHFMVFDSTQNWLRDLGARRRLRPDFLIIGAQKAGTTSLYDYLVQHPQIAAARTKEVHFFDHHFARGTTWYERQFASRRAFRETRITGEASPFYLLHPRAPERARQLLPDVKLLVVLRNPVDRAFSHYQHNVRKRVWAADKTETPTPREPLSFEDALDAEDARLRGEIERVGNEENYRSRALLLHSYQTRGLYAQQLERWFEVFPRERFFIVENDELAADAQHATARVLTFLGLLPIQLENAARKNVGGYRTEIAPQTRAALVEYFRPHNARLYELLGHRLDWDK